MDWRTTPWSVDVADTFSLLLPVEGLTKPEVEPNDPVAWPMREEPWALVLFWLAVVGAGDAGGGAAAAPFPPSLFSALLGTRVRFAYLHLVSRALLPLLLLLLLLRVETAPTDGISPLLSCRFLFAWC